MLRQQISGIFNISMPLIIVYLLFPNFLLHLTGQMICSFAVGVYLFLLSYKQIHQMTKALQFSPTGEHKEHFQDLIKSCNLEQKSVELRYAYTNESIAMTVGSTVIIDPILWHGVADDVQAMHVGAIFKEHIEPRLTDAQKQRLTSIYRLLTPSVQNFLFRHELGHVVHHFSLKKLLIIFSIGFVITYIGIQAALYALPVHGLIAIIFGVIVAGSLDLFLTYVSNILFKLQAEKGADRFAVRYSLHEEVVAAANFFVQHQLFLHHQKNIDTTISKVPSIFQGYQNGVNRSAYLLKILSEKK